MRFLSNQSGWWWISILDLFPAAHYPVHSCGCGYLITEAGFFKNFKRCLKCAPIIVIHSVWHLVKWLRDKGGREKYLTVTFFWLGNCCLDTFPVATRVNTYFFFCYWTRCLVSVWITTSTFHVLYPSNSHCCGARISPVGCMRSLQGYATMAAMMASLARSGFTKTDRFLVDRKPGTRSRRG